MTVVSLSSERFSGLYPDWVQTRWTPAFSTAPLALAAPPSGSTALVLQPRFYSPGLQSWSTDLVLAVVLLGVAQHAVAEAADVAEGGVALVSQLLQPQHGPVAAVRERGLQQLEDLHTAPQGPGVTTGTGVTGGSPQGPGSPGVTTGTHAWDQEHA